MFRRGIHAALTANWRWQSLFPNWLPLARMANPSQANSRSFSTLVASDNKSDNGNIAPLEIECANLSPQLSPVTSSPMFIVAPEEVQKQFHIMSIAQMPEALNIVWADGHKSTFDYFWLRDNCHCPFCHHPHADERMLDTCSIPDAVVPKQLEAKSTFLRITWAPVIDPATNDVLAEEHTSDFDLRFLREHCFSPRPAHQSELDHAYVGRLWKAADFADKRRVPTISYTDVMSREDSFFHWLEMIRTYGFSVITDVPTKDHDEPNDGYAGQVAQRISFLRTTFWGDSWSVRSEPNPRNLSLTGVELFPHTDFSWSETPPGLQFLHCVEFSGGEGGESTLVDGYAVAEHLRHNDPETFRTLKDVPLRHYFTSLNESYSCLGTTIRLDEKGLVQQIRLNQANRAPIEADPTLVRQLYRALNIFQRCCRSDDFLLKFMLREGEMLVFNNHRLLHGRGAYDPRNTVRHLKGCYLDWDQFQSKYSVLRAAAKNTLAQSTSGAQHGLMSGLLTGVTPQQQQQTRHFSTAAAAKHDPGYDNFNAQFVAEALKPYSSQLESGELYPDGSSLKEVADRGAVAYRTLKEGTKADYIYQCALFQHDIEVNLVPRIIGMLRKLEGEHVRLGTAAQVDLFEHSIQTATRALADKADEEMVVVALLHDIGEMMSPMNHGKVAGSILEPYISPESLWLLNHHEIFQGYYYFAHVGGNPNTRDIYRDNPAYQLTVDFCEKWDQPSFDPDFDSLPVQVFEPMLRRVLARKPYWHFPNHPKLGVVNIREEEKEEKQ